MQYTILSLIFAGIFCLATSQVSAQGGDEPEVNERVANEQFQDQSRQALFNASNLNTDIALKQGGAFYVSNPSPTYEVDLELAYHQPVWQKTAVTLADGKGYEIQGRYRVIDQAFEVLHEGEAYELKKDQLVSIFIGQDRFLLLPDPLFKKKGAVIYQLHYGSDLHQLLEFHDAYWQDPPEQNMFDTSEQHRTIKRKEELIFRTGGSFHPLKSPKDLLNILELSKKSPEATYARKEKLKLNKAEDVIRFLEYLENR